MTSQRELSGTSVGEADARLLLDLALHMAERADEIALEGFHAVERVVENKPDGTPVTDVDRAVESMIRATIEREHPEAGVLGEEYGSERGVGRWVIDPIDGTSEFMRRDPRFATLIAYELDDVARVGVVSAPALGVRWWAGEGCGARLSYRGEVTAARVSITRRIDRSFGMMLGGSGDDGWESRARAESVRRELAKGGARLASKGVSWEAVRVSAGEFDFAFSSGWRWDVAPMPLIIEEAGGNAWLTEDAAGRSRLTVSNRQLADIVSPHAG